MAKFKKPLEKNSLEWEERGTDQQEHPEMETPTQKKLVKIAKTALKKGKQIEKDLEIFCSSILHGQVRRHRFKQDPDEETDFFPRYEFHIEGHIRYSPEGKKTS